MILPWYRRFSRPVHVVAGLIVCDALILIDLPVVATLGAIGLLLIPGLQFVSVCEATARLRSAPFVGAAASLVLLPLFFAPLWNLLITQWSLTLGINMLALLLCVPQWFRRTEVAHDVLPGEPGSRRPINWYHVILIWTGLTIFCTFALPQLPARRQGVEIGDYVKHHALLMTLEAERLPLRSPFYAAAPEEKYYYYHFAYFWPAALRQLSGGDTSVGIAFSVFASLVALAFVATTFEIARRFCHADAAGVIAAACVSVIGGMDVLPQLIRVFSGQPVAGIMDSWIPSPWRIHNLATQYVWCPQHVLSLLALLLATLLMGQKWNPRFWLVFTPLICVAVFGMSAFVSLTVLPAIAMTGLLLAFELRKERGSSIASLFSALILIAGTFFVLALPQLQGYLEAGRRLPGEFTTEWPRLPWSILGRAAPPGVIANWLDLPWIFLIDFGIAGIALVFAPRGFWRDAWRQPGIRALVLAGVAGVIGSFTFRNSAHDFVYGFRVCAMALVPVGAIAVGAAFFGCYSSASRLRNVRAILVTAGILGLSIGLLEMPFMAFRSLRSVSDAERAAAHFVRSALDTRAVVQPEPDHR
ncbi:MAG: hypothetical protein AB7N71_13955, partial [Phycisphaerae bacterium]